MQVTETKAEGLRREYAITVAAATLEEKTNARLETVRADFQMKGFRKGKAPMPLLKKMFGKSVLGEVLQESVDEAVRSHLEEAGHRPAGQPDVKVTNEDFNEGDDLTLEVKYDCLPEVPEVDFGAITLEKKVVEVDDAAVEEALGTLAKQAQDFEEKEGAAEEGDQVVIDFLGKVADEAFEGGAAEDYPLVIGSNQFIPGFEEQLVGASAGEAKEVAVKFPDEYGAAHLAGADAVFEVTVKEVRSPKDAEIDDALASRFGAETLDELRGQIRERIGEEFAGASRTLLKRRLLDALDERVAFELPPTLVEQEAKSVARQLWQEEHAGTEGEAGAAGDAGDEESAAAPSAEEIEPDENHTKLAERRVRLGLLLAEVGQRENVEISEGEMGQAIMAEARRYPGQEREFFEFVKQNRGALEAIRAPVFEDKVIDLILDRAAVTDVTVTKDALQEELESLDDA